MAEDVTTEAERLHSLLLQAATSEEVSAVIKLHAPRLGSWAAFPASCDGCEQACNCDAIVWVECPTLKALNVYLHVDGYPVEAGQP